MKTYGQWDVNDHAYGLVGGFNLLVSLRFRLMMGYNQTCIKDRMFRRI